MKQKAPFVLGLIGVIIGFLLSIQQIFSYFIFKNFQSGWFGNFFNVFGVDINSILLLSLISAVIGLVIGVVITIYLIKIKKEPIKKNYIIFTVLSAISLFTGFGFGGLLCLIGGIIGIVKTK